MVDDLLDQLHESMAEAARFRVALERIAGTTLPTGNLSLQKIAREALSGLDERPQNGLSHPAGSDGADG